MNDQLNKATMIEWSMVIALAISLSILISITWENSIIENISSILFTVFIPGIWIAMQVSGGPHNASEINIAIGVVAQTIFVYWVVRFIILKLIKTKLGLTQQTAYLRDKERPKYRYTLLFRVYFAIHPFP